ncbi:MAG: hypothetical protein EOO38_09580 [Cytophagaceae bacterium]|nr:MAG: hypothetical protein EOO38_09580 [Cytophagaceae bacterium]
MSSSGRGVFDCLTGEKVARDYTDNVVTDPYLECEGIGPLAGRLIRMSATSGGGLPVASSDGWSVETVALNWPDHHLLLVESGSWLYGALCNWP